MNYPERIVLIRPCCIGDVVLATAPLRALRRAYPYAHITLAVGSWSRRAVEHHPDLNAILDTGPAAMPVRSVGGFWRFWQRLRVERFSMAISLVRSPLMSLAVGLSGIPRRVGLDSGGRGFGYNVRVPVDPDAPRHEGEVYLDAVRALGLDVSACWANVPIPDETRESLRRRLRQRGIAQPLLVINPTGGHNPGMRMASKRWPPANFAALADALHTEWGAQSVLLGGPDDGAIVNEVRALMRSHRPETFIGALSFLEIGALAAEAWLYIGNDTGLTHLAAAAGGRTVMILGPSDPRRYAPFTPDALAIWKPHERQTGGVAAGGLDDWDWERDGVSVDEVLQQLHPWLRPSG